MRVLLALLAAVAMWLPLAVGCGGPAIPADELGEVLFELPKVPGADQPYPLPESSAMPPRDTPPPER